MAVSAFRSTSKRGNYGQTSSSIISAKDNTEGPSKKAPPRRSRSVSAVTRSYPEISSSSLSNQVDFSNKRDNPLFRSADSSSSPVDRDSENAFGITKFDQTPKKLMDNSVTDNRRGRSVSRSSEISLGIGSGLDSRRGRSISRNQISNPPKQLGRSLSRVDSGRRRSVSRGPCGNSESDMEQDQSLGTRLRIKNGFESSKQTKNLQTWSSQHPLSEPLDCSIPCLQATDWEDSISASSYSEADVRTIKAVFEQTKSDHQAGDAKSGEIYETVRSEVQRVVSDIRHDVEDAIRRKNSAITAATDIADVSPELVNPNAIELISDIRREYATKLEQSQERARTLRAILTAEEQRGKELGRILKEILPDPKTPESQKPRPRRKTSIERRKMMSRRLTEEAMNYFDECVSISTFDSSDFSSPEDPSSSLVVSNPGTGGSRFCLNGDSSVSTAYCSQDYLHQNKESDNRTPSYLGHGVSESTATCSSKETSQNLKSGNRNDFPSNQSQSLKMERDGFHDIRSFVKMFGKEPKKDEAGYREIRSSYDLDDYDWNLSAECLLFEKLILKNRINSGGLLLCDIRIN